MQVHRKYASPIHFNEIVEPVTGFLGLFDEIWRIYLS